jgi:hypothetical protein
MFELPSPSLLTISNFMKKFPLSPSALQSYPSVTSKNLFYHASNVKYYSEAHALLYKMNCGYSRANLYHLQLQM